MHACTAIKWGHRLLTAVLLVAVVGFCMIQFLSSGRYNDRLYSQKPLTDKIWLYVTQYQNAGATDSDVYRYYLYRHIDGDPMNVLGDSAPFLTADRSDVSVSGVGSRITVKMTGKIYSFSNSSFFYDGKMPVMPTIDIDAKGINAWRE
ncbi:hypothetical protein IG612_11975 [Pectobacterium sp. FL60-S17]|uniref:Uncharacterized protein n=1 Tax=Pectobacterium quasiaquaticum TaxID=2774015 RepID=A0A9Q2EYZ7_9GAMM|nr:hypothetical protein [Pectobacterium quasiaquaticum]MBE5203312.1 hypothetical protein [Pectobacterium quasiaquaticum]MBE5208750.1 hypothetical protein [Pectobacterium quasiaquaticum]MBE5221160.1 hypothetical protein [Pectobacterium quasiaquaticum]URG49419.1 hypothetical protein IG609_002160 [Pectobacterium quasiaquaticum]